MRTITGIDPHKSSLRAVAGDDKGTVPGTRRLRVNKGTVTALLKWAAAFEDPLFAVEGAKGLGRSVSQILVARNQAVVDVPATLSMGIRVLTTGGRKTDPQDARAVALAALHYPSLHQVAAEDQDTVLGLLTQARDALKSERTRLLDRLHRLFRELLDGGVPTGLPPRHHQRPHRPGRPDRATDEEIPGPDQ